MEIGQIETSYGMARIVLGRYASTGALSVRLVEENGQPLATFSVNLKQNGADVADTEFTIKDWSENSWLVEPMLNSGHFEDTGRVFKMDYITSPIWRLKHLTVLPLYVI